jgi:N utilization substance protein B
MTRKEAREQAFILIFEKNFNQYEVSELIELAKESRDFLEDRDGYVLSVVSGTFENLDKIDETIANNLSGWTISRISKVSLSLLRLALFEMLYMQDIPVAVSIDEAVELSKKYSTIEDSAFINGVLGSVAKSI